MESTQVIKTGEELAGLIARQIITRRPVVAASILGMAVEGAPSQFSPEEVKDYLEQHQVALRERLAVLFGDEMNDVILRERLSQLSEADCPPDVLEQLGLNAISFQVIRTGGQGDFGSLASALAQVAVNLKLATIESVIANTQQLSQEFSEADPEAVAVGIVAQASLAYNLAND